MSTDKEQDYEHDHEWWEFFYDFAPGMQDYLDDEDAESVEQAIERVKREREKAYDRAMEIL